jgi:hypothetical protein
MMRAQLVSLQALIAAWALLALCGAIGCTTTELSGDRLDPEDVRDIRIGALELSYSPDLPADRRQRAQQLRLAEQVGELVELWMTEAKHWSGADRLRLEIVRFRLPGSGRWVTGAMKGSDFLAAQATVLRDGESLAVFEVEHTIGAGDRSIAENYSANRAVENLIEAVAWSIAYELAPRGTRGTILEIGKREQIERAIQTLYTCKELSYAEELKFSALGKLNTGFGSFRKRPEWCRYIY